MLCNYYCYSWLITNVTTSISFVVDYQYLHRILMSKNQIKIQNYTNEYPYKCRKHQRRAGELYLGNISAAFIEFHVLVREGLSLLLMFLRRPWGVAIILLCVNAPRELVADGTK